MGGLLGKFLSVIVGTLGITASIASSSIPVATTSPVMIEPAKKEVATTTVNGLFNSVFENSVERSLMKRVAFCESSMMHFDSSGKVIQGVINPFDSGIFQVNKKIHGAKAVELGLDLDTLEGNMLYARYLFERNGVDDWKASEPCWKSFFDRK